MMPGYMRDAISRIIRTARTGISMKRYLKL